MKKISEGMYSDFADPSFKTTSANVSSVVRKHCSKSCDEIQTFVDKVRGRGENVVKFVSKLKPMCDNLK